MLFLSGLRGAIAFALAIRNTLTDARQMILTTTLVIVMVTVVLCGGSTVSLLTWFDIPLGVEDDEDKAPLTASATPTHNYSSMSEAPPLPPGNTPADKSMAAKAWSGFDTKYMKPLLTHSNPTLMETLPDCCGSMGRLLTSTEQLSKHPAMMNSSTQNPDELGSPDFKQDDLAIPQEVIAVEKSTEGSVLPSNI